MNVQLIANWPANAEKPDDSWAELQNVTDLSISVGVGFH